MISFECDMRSLLLCQVCNILGRMQNFVEVIGTFSFDYRKLCCFYRHFNSHRHFWKAIGRTVTSISHRLDGGWADGSYFNFRRLGLAVESYGMT
jgi:hypothetical protein